MNYRILFPFLFSGLFASLIVRGQTDFTLNSLDFNPHRVTVNPAYMPQADFYLGLPVLSNIYGNFSNNSFTYRDLIRKKTGTDSIYFDFVGLLSGMRKTNFITTQANLDWVSFGWLEGRYYISGNITEKVSLRTRFSKELIETAVHGNAPKIGETVDLGNLFLNMTHYREYALRVSRDFKCKLRLGVTAKFIQGMENIDINRSKITLATAPVNFDLSGQSDILINTSGMKNFSGDSLKSWTYLFERGNRGWGVDLGGSYEFSNKLSVAASILDIGRIRWKFQPVNYYNSVPDYSFSGVQLNQFFTSNTDTVINGVQTYLDSLGGIFSIKDRSERYATSLPTRFYFSGKYILKNKNDINALIFGNIFRNRIYPSVSVGFTKRFSDVLEFNANWSFHNNSLANIGTGFALNLGLTQFHFATDNIIGLFGQYHTRSVNIRAGINLVTDYIGNRTNFCDKDNDGVPNPKDDCPDVPGLPGLNGCPDKDGDGIADKFDECPLEPGTVEFKGCPDRDYDKIVDKLDKCPDEPGKTELNGCPDRDDDGIPDVEDDCPNLKGFVYLKGCPDRDNDSIPDKEDECPDFPGPRIYSGCPDTDKDSIIDKNDMCPEEFGLRKLQGCPDKDHDGVYDKIDLCPDDSGSVSMKGCPFSDRDNDGIRDEQDACPTNPGPIENKGCPLQDRDGDAIIDLLDRCPTVKGVPENNGCPALAEEEQKILNTAFENLEFETGKSIIRSSSFASLNDLAQLLREKPELRLLVSGHTDNVGKPANNLLLSKNRSKAVATYLTKQGVPATRLKSEWFGQTRPIESNTTPEGRQKNRRVELSVLF